MRRLSLHLFPEATAYLPQFTRGRECPGVPSDVGQALWYISPDTSRESLELVCGPVKWVWVWVQVGGLETCEGHWATAQRRHRCCHRCSGRPCFTACKGKQEEQTGGARCGGDAPPMPLTHTPAYLCSLCGPWCPQREVP